MTRRAGTTAAGLFVAVAALYLPSVRNGFVYDDHEVILAQAPPRSVRDVARVFAEPHGLPQSQLPYYRATTRATLLVQKAWTGDAPGPFHAANALLTAAIAVAAWWLVRQPAFGFSPAAAAWIAAAFAAHPIASECTYPAASGRETAMPTLFCLVALAAWIRGGRGVAALAYAAALWSKEIAVAVPALAAWADALRLAPDPPGRRPRAWIARYAPLVLVTIAYFFVRSRVLPGWASDARDPAVLFSAITENPWGPLQSLLFLAQAAIAPSMDLAYEPGFESWFEPARAVAAVAVLAASIALALGAAPAERPAPSRAASLFWIGWMPVAMALHLNLLPLEVPFAERFVFLASLGAIALVATAARRVAARAGMPRAAVVAGVAALALLAATTLHRGHFYRDELAFTEQWAATSPATGNARASHGAALARAGHVDEAVAELREAVRLEPRQASAHYNLGVMLARVGRRDAAIDAFREALRWWSADPDAHYALGVLLAQRGERDPGATHLREAVRLRPDFPEASAALRSLANE